MMFLAYVVVFSVVSCCCIIRGVAAEEGHVHKCACEAVEFGFSIDCDDTAAMLTAMAALQAGGCSADCSSAECEKNFLIVQSHHDYCAEDALPAEVEDGFHDFDGVCAACDISRPSSASLVDCPTASCDDESGDTAYIALIADGCLSNGCDATLCQDNFFLLKAVHDNCPEGSLTEESEAGLHDLEDACVAAGVSCNSGGGDDDPLVCSAEDLAHAAEHAAADGGSAAASAVGLVGILVGATSMILA